MKKRFPLFTRIMSANLLWALSLLMIAGCQTRPDDAPAKIHDVTRSVESNSVTNSSRSLILGEGDVLKITFPGAPNLDSVQQIRRDGKITMQLIGEVSPVGMTPTDLEKEIIRLYGEQLVSKEVMVTVTASSFPVFVTGAVMRPGKIMSDRPITALQSIMESGGFDYSRANLKTVRIIREENGVVNNYTVNLKLPLQGKKSEPFALKPADIVYVPEKFSWF